MVTRIVRFFKKVGLTLFAYRNDREPAIVAMIEEACGVSGRRGVKISPGSDVPDEYVDVSHLSQMARSPMRMLMSVTLWRLTNLSLMLPRTLPRLNSHILANQLPMDLPSDLWESLWTS